MYPQRISQTIMSTKHNLNKKLFTENHHYFFNYSLMIRQKLGELKYFQQVNKKLHDIVKNGKIYKLIVKFPQSSKNQSNSTLKVWAHHFECVVAQRLRRCQQMFCLYSRWWEERALKEFIRKMRQSLTRRGRDLALGAVGISAYNWDENRISDDYMKKHVNELDYVTVLRENTICLPCDSPENSKMKTNFCKCGAISKPSNKTYDEWAPFIEKDDLIVWRRPHPSGQSEYKVYGSYDDVSAEDFLNVQVDTDYRRIWDTTAVMLEVAETDSKANSNSDIIYWEMLWPRLFVNRDYVFNRRYLIDRESNTLFIVSKSTKHPKYPKYPDKFRIEDYWSCMVIKPYTDMSEPGIEFSLTYYDNPGVNIPSSVTTWVAMRAMPDFLGKLREATKNYKEYCVRDGVSKACIKIREEEKAKEEQRERDKLDYCTFIPSKIAQLKAACPKPFVENKKPRTDRSSLNKGNVSHGIDNSPLDINSTPSAVQSQNSSWKYLHPLYYFQ